jgi:hypothetical protein
MYTCIVKYTEKARTLWVIQEIFKGNSDDKELWIHTPSLKCNWMQDLTPMIKIFHLSFYVIKD